MKTIAPAPSIVRAILVEVGEKHGVSPQEITGKKRTVRIVQARREAWERMRKRGWSFHAIADLTGCNHSTVIEALMLSRTQLVAVTTRVSPEVKDAITALAKKQGRTVSETAASLLLSGLANHSTVQTTNSRIIRLHQAGEFDTVEIARMVGRPESDVANTIGAWREMRRAAQ